MQGESDVQRAVGCRREDIQQNPKAVSLLTPEQYRVAQQDGTERPFQNEYWDNKEPGLYLDLVSGEPLFVFHR